MSQPAAPGEARHGAMTGEGRRRILSRPRNLDFLLWRRTDFLRRFLKPGQRVLDVGSGYGVPAAYVPGPRFVSTDAEPQPWLDAAADAHALPFADASFDAVVCLHVLHHLERPRRALGEMCRVLRPGGLILVAEPRASWALRAVLALTGHEYVDAGVDPFGDGSCQAHGKSGNNAVGDILFGDLGRFRAAFPSLAVEHHRLLECLCFLNSGGVGTALPCLPLPQAFLRVLWRVDESLCALAPGVFALCRELALRKQPAAGGGP